MQGGELVFEMGQLPTDWGVDKSAWPPQKASKNLLVPTPYFSTSNNTFKDTLQVQVASLCTDCQIFMATPHENPAVFSGFVYRQEITIGADQKIGAFALAPDGRSSDTIWTTFYKLDNKINLILKSEYANEYSAGGDQALIDRQYGTANFRTGSWQGYQGQDFEAILDLGELKNEVDISIGFLQDIKSWIWYPQKVEFWVYYGDDVVEIYEDYPGKRLETKEGEMRTTVSVHLKKPSQKIKIVAKSIGACPDWHLGAGGESWIFIDEIEVK